MELQEQGNEKERQIRKEKASTMRNWRKKKCQENCIQSQDSRVSDQRGEDKTRERIRGSSRGGGKEKVHQKGKKESRRIQHELEIIIY